LNFFALIGRELIYQGQSVSPAQFVNLVGGTFRNAWTTIWVRMPCVDEWKPALALRKKTTPFKSK
jgi:hypothetical protein